ncbi:MAG: ureidoglycolate lyase [Candidatus Pacebacteria bacterium]|nr:ureidoglycolate lyase [Candidatus Paceibacterota bacterium]
MVKLEPLTRAAFADFGDVIDCDGVTPKLINQGFAKRYNNLSPTTDLGGLPADGLNVNISIFVAQPRPMPIEIKLMERHPLATQAFYPTQNQEWLVVVAGDPQREESYRGFRATGRQGVTYGKNIWHHPLLVLQPDSYFVIVDRRGPEANLEEVELKESLFVGLGLF